jgi:hypothetical protein
MRDSRLAAAAGFVRSVKEAAGQDGVGLGRMMCGQLDEALLALVAGAWTDTLGLPADHPPLHLQPLGADFGQLGGDSLAALRAVRELHKAVLLRGERLPPLDSGTKSFIRHFELNPNVWPRQAWDKRRENSKKALFR